MYKFVIDVKEVHTVPVKVEPRQLKKLYKSNASNQEWGVGLEHMEFSQTLDPQPGTCIRIEPGSDKYDLVY